jgi:hypothetical protein
MYHAAMAAAKRPAIEDGPGRLAETPCIETLAIATTYLKDIPEGRGVAAAVKIAVTIAGSDKEESRETLQIWSIISKATSARQALNALNFIVSRRGFITSGWSGTLQPTAWRRPPCSTPLRARERRWFQGEVEGRTAQRRVLDLAS